MRVVIFTKIPLFPTNGGNRARILTLVNALKALGHTVSFVLIPSKQMGDFDESSHITFFGRDEFVIAKLTKFDIFLKNVNIVSHILAHWVRQKLRRPHHRHDNVDYIFPRFLARRVFLSVKERSFDCVIVEYVHYSHILDFYPPETRKIIDTHDSFMLEFTDRAEAEGFTRADVVMAIQNKEKLLFERIIQENFPTSKTRTALIGHFIEPSAACDLTHTDGATFLGSNFPANRLSLDWFLNEVFPKILLKRPDFVLMIAGTVGVNVTPHPSIRILGTVPTVRDAFTSAPILINPIVSGTGLKIKLMDAISLGVPVVSTMKGVEGIEPDFLGGVVVVPDSDSAAFAEATLRVYSDAAYRTSLGERALAAGRSMQEGQLAALQAVL
ncbi:MAG: glycosyltransferase family 4 protein [Acetobacter aceti]|uniref:Glycosyl transferase n=1 Tax=Acetobacter aceti TaxID=435 RepID=A0A1U9KGN2_ACEAC|nr:glycosyltransferase family 4 protein [Acetobacter aceti]AQS84961.1 hypothetical protein A0U92_09435 [Acetobacter aceti]